MSSTNQRGFDVVDTRTDTLYCSYACAAEAGTDPGDLEAVSTAEYDTQRQQEGPGEGWGAICPICEGEYNGY